MKIWSCLFFNEEDQHVKFKLLYNRQTEKKDCFSFDGFCSHCIISLRLGVVSITFAPVRKYVFLSEYIERGIKKKELDKLRQNYIKQKGFTVIEMWECAWWRLYKTGPSVEEQIREKLPYRPSLAAYQILEEIKSANKFGYVQFDIEVPGKLKLHLANYSSIFKKVVVELKYCGKSITQALCRRRLEVSTSDNANFKLQLTKGMLKTPLLLFYQHMGLVCTKMHRFVGYTPKNCFNNFLKSTADARTQGDDNLISSAVSETIDRLGNEFLWLSMIGSQSTHRNKVLKQ